MGCFHRYILISVFERLEQFREKDVKSFLPTRGAVHGRGILRDKYTRVIPLWRCNIEILLTAPISSQPPISGFAHSNCCIVKIFCVYFLNCVVYKYLVIIHDWVVFTPVVMYYK